MNTNSYSARKIFVLPALVAIVIFSGARQRVQGQQWTGPDANGTISNTNTGNVAVGNSAPVNLLDVGSAVIGAMVGKAIVVSNSTGPSTVAVGQSATARGRLKWNFNAAEASAYLALGVTSGTNPLILQDAGGNVGIGTTNPTYKLSVEGNAYVLGGTSSPFYEGFRVRANDFATNGGYLLFGKQTGNGGYGVIQSGDNQNYRTLSLNPWGGNIGVGTTGPTNLFHINSGATPSSQLRLSANNAGSFSGMSHAPDNAALGFDVDWSTGTGWIARHSTVATLYKLGGKLQMLGWTGATVGSPIPDFTVHTSLDLTTGRFGIGTANPGYKLDVQGGQINSSGGLCIAGDCKTAWSQVGGGSQWTTSGSNIYYNSGNVGIGTTAPGGPIEVRDSGGRQILWNMASQGHTFLNANGGNVHVAGNLYFNGTNWNRFNPAAAGGMWWAGGDGTLGVLQAPAGANPVAAFNWNFFIGTTGNVGIGSNTPGYKLDVQGGQINSSGGLCIAGDCKTAWSQVGGGSSQWTTSGSNIHYNSGNVGIGTTNPGARLHISAGDSSVALFGPNASWSGSLAVGSGGELLSPVAARGQVFSSNGNLHLDAGVGQNVYLSWLTPTNTIINGQGGNVAIGNTSPTEKLHVTGNGKFTGNLTVDGNINAKYQDVAEWVPSSERLSAGTVVVLDPTKTNQVIASTIGYDTRVAGVISAQPGITLGESGEGKVLVATTGRVRVKVDASRGAIQIGDLLVTGDVPGVAMKSEPVEFAGRKMHMPGTIIGKALEPLAKGQGEILVLLSLQ
jgi:hypothetical protein